MRGKWLIYPLALILAACNYETNDMQNQSGLSAKGRLENIQQADLYGLLTAELGTPRDHVEVHEKDLHGRFFRERAEFYVVKDPQLYISNSRVEALTLYFVDGVLCKKKYTLVNDISKELIRSYGGFRFVPLNQHTRNLIRSEAIVRKTEGGHVLNEELDDYEMKWMKEEVLVRYRLPGIRRKP